MNATLHTTPQITEFATQVRAQLADLPADEIDELTEGLEADLAEAFAEDLARELPDPVAYALELRTAAGLPPAEVEARTGILQSLGGVAESIRLKRAGLVANIRQSALGAGILDLLAELRPAWWVLRAWVAYQLGAAVFGFEGPVLPQDGARWAILFAFAVVSVQWGRRAWLPAKGMGTVILVGNVLAAVWLLPSLVTTYHWQNDLESNAYFDDGAYVNQVDEPQAGVALNGKDVTNIFAYDATGKPLKGVQLFDQDGHPLATSVPGGNGCLENTPCVDGGDEGSGVWVPSVLETGAKAWNVYPMRMRAAKFDDSTGQLVADPTQDPEDRTSPFIKVPAVLDSPKADGKVDKGND